MDENNKIHRIDLYGLIAPLCMLTCKKKLAGMKAGERVEFLFYDMDVVEDMTRIVENSKDRIVSVEEVEGHYRVCVEIY